MTVPIQGTPVYLIQPAFRMVGIAYCFYLIAIRWPAVRNKYGSTSLYWWPAAIVFAFSITGWFLEVAIWFAQRELSN